MDRTSTSSDSRLDAGPGSVRDGARTERTRGGGRALASAVLALALALVAVVVIVQNSDPVRLEALWWSLDASLALVIVAAAAIGALLALLARTVARHRRSGIRAA